MPLPRCARDRHARVLERTNTAEHGAHLRLPWAHLCLPRPHTRMGARIHGGCRDTPTVVCPPNTYFFARSPRAPSCVLSSLPLHPPSLTPHLHPPHSAQGEGHAYCPACPAGDLRVPGAFALGTHGKDVQISRQNLRFPRRSPSPSLPHGRPPRSSQRQPPQEALRMHRNHPSQVVLIRHNRFAHSLFHKPSRSSRGHPPQHSLPRRPSPRFSLRGAVLTHRNRPRALLFQILHLIPLPVCTNAPCVTRLATTEGRVRHAWAPSHPRAPSNARAPHSSHHRAPRSSHHRVPSHPRAPHSSLHRAKVHTRARHLLLQTPPHPFSRPPPRSTRAQPPQKALRIHRNHTRVGFRTHLPASLPRRERAPSATNPATTGRIVRNLRRARMHAHSKITRVPMLSVYADCAAGLTTTAAIAQHETSLICLILTPQKTDVRSARTHTFRFPRSLLATAWTGSSS